MRVLYIFISYGGRARGHADEMCGSIASAGLRPKSRFGGGGDDRTIDPGYKYCKSKGNASVAKHEDTLRVHDYSKGLH